MAQQLRLICCSVPSEPTAVVDVHSYLLIYKISMIYKEILETSSSRILSNTSCSSGTVRLGKKLSIKSSTFKLKKRNHCLI